MRPTPITKQGGAGGAQPPLLNIVRMFISLIGLGIGLGLGLGLGLRG